MKALGFHVPNWLCVFVKLLILWERLLLIFLIYKMLDTDWFGHLYMLCSSVGRSISPAVRIVLCQCPFYVSISVGVIHVQILLR